jgi:hypothetical protein
MPQRDVTGPVMRLLGTAAIIHTALLALAAYLVRDRQLLLSLLQNRTFTLSGRGLAAVITLGYCVAGLLSFTRPNHRLARVAAAAVVLTLMVWGAACTWMVVQQPHSHRLAMLANTLPWLPPPTVLVCVLLWLGVRRRSLREIMAIC